MYQRLPLKWLFSLAMLWGAMPLAAQDAAERRNWFSDPFFQIAAQAPRCPVPLGPYLTVAEQRAEAHYRAERGTSCWLAGRCARSNAYAYDQDIARALQARVGELKPATGSSLWVTVQRRIVFIEGCVPDRRRVAALEAWAKGVPDVEQVLVNVSTRSKAPAPYRTLTSP
jgi:hypothetical protein